jgi:hypothetical protein
MTEQGEHLNAMIALRFSALLGNIFLEDEP